jgi:mannose-6-phosphate isomerase-like protein (cupin superfamily)
VATNQGEVHDAADDIFLILEGTAIFILGGKLDAPKETQPGEWRAPGISGGKEVKVNKGDVLIVPRGTPHRRITSGLDVTLMLIKSSAPVKN